VAWVPVPRDRRRNAERSEEETAMPLILWLLGVPLSLIIILWLIGVV
jgi:hypothetical protein